MVVYNNNNRQNIFRKIHMLGLTGKARKSFIKVCGGTKQRQHQRQCNCFFTVVKYRQWNIRLFYRKALK